MKKNVLKIRLDIILLFLFVFMFNKQIFGQAFHEIGGLVLCGLLILHLLLNWKTVLIEGKKLFSKALPTTKKVNFILSILLLIGFLWIALSGIMISKVIFTGISGYGMFWKVWHYFISAWVLIAVGIHIGLNWNFVKKIIGKWIHIPKKIQKPCIIILAVIILLSGGYHTVTSGFTKWMGGPFIASNMHEKGEGFMRQKSQMLAERTERPAFKNGEGTFLPKGERKQLRKGKEGDMNFSFGGMLQVIFTYGSITLLFTVLTQLFLQLRKRIHRHQ